MGIQDDIFDVASALEGKPEESTFDDICSYIGDIERELDMYMEFYRGAASLKLAIDKLERKNEN